MEKLSASLPKKSFRENGFGGKTVYDDVFGGSAKFGVPILSPCVEDYTEIFEGFHASRGSSVPILDIPPVVDEAVDLFFDVRSSKFDYSEVFGGFNALDFAVSYEELFKQTNGGDDSSFEAWTPAQSESLSDESDPSACSEKNQSLSSGDLPPSFDGTKPFNILYHKANPNSKEDMLNGMTHVTQSDTVPEYSSTLNETPPAQKMEDEKLHLHLNLNTDFGGKVTEGKRFSKTMSQPPNSGFGVQEYANELRPSFGLDKASPRKAFISVSDISLRTQPSHLPPPSRPPPTFADIKGNFCRVNSKLKASKSYAFERMEADSSPAYFDLEIDASSSTAASAAMKDAVEKAQAQPRSAKELMECKKVGLQSRTKLHLETGIEHKGEKTSKSDRFNNFQDEGVHSTCEREGNEMEPYAAERMKKVRNTTQVVSGVTDGEGQIHLAVESALNDHGKEHTSSQGSRKTEGSVAWREVTQFYEVVETKKLKDEKTLAQQSKSHDCGQKEKGTREALRVEYTRRIKAASVDPEQEETGEQFDVLKGAKGLNRQEEHQEKANVDQKVRERQEKEKKTGMTLLLGETEKILYELDICEDVEILTKEQMKENEMVSEQNLMGVNERVEYEKIVKEALDSKDNGREIKESFGSKEYERKFKEDVDLVENRGKLKEALGLGTKEKQEKEFHELEEIEKKQEKTREIGENKKKIEAALESEGKTKWSKEVIEQEENVNRLKVDLKQQEKNKEQKGACEAEQNEKISEENPEQEENAKKQEKAYDRRESEARLTDDCESEKNEKRLKEAWEEEENEKRLQEVDESDDTDEGVELHFKENDTKDRSKEASEREDYENGIRDDINCEGFCRQDSVHVQNKGEENNRKLNLHQGIYVNMEGQKASDGACNLGETKAPQATGVVGNDKIHEKLETQKALLHLHEENERLRTEPKNCKREIEAVEGKNGPIEERVNSSGMDQNDLLPEKTNNRTEATKESLCLRDCAAKSSEDVISIGEIHIDKSKGVSEIVSDSENTNILTRKEIESRKNINGVQFAFDQGENKDKFMSSQVVREGVEHERKFRDVLPAQKFASQIPGKKAMNLNEKLTLEEREKDERLKRERNLENDRLRRIEEREREREREKDRMAVDTATLEARESAFSEGRDRAERAAVERAVAEVRLRALAEARERLEKASAEARERLTSERGLTEARLKVKRAAVDRATAEARERAFEKAMAEKASFEARERVERSVADKFSAYSRNRGLRQTSSSSDLHYQSVGSYHDLKYSHSSVHGGLEGESAQRCKARLERHQRTAERAAKALAEKNMRDLLAHKEQVERNRFAEALDAEVKRWSSGKEGNLRALLSTLQYILGPDSGWQPIPLTDVITDVAVKKAYRKATLCVHPDKLQQRGSSIQQKYICEKVFDLLKEAWNKFNSVER